MSTAENLLPTGTRVMIDVSWLTTVPVRSMIHMQTAVVQRYVTPEIQRNQVWRDETYAVIIEGERLERRLNRDSLVVLP